MERIEQEGPLFRSVPIEGRNLVVSEDGRVMLKDLSFSSEEPVLRYGWDGPYYEILDHSPESVVLDRILAKGPVRDEHWGPRVGEIRSFELAGDKSRGDIELSRNRQVAIDLANDLKDDIGGNVSISYLRHERKLEKESDEGPPTYRVTKWEPVHVAFVGEPADITVGMGMGRDAGQLRHECRVVQPDEFTRAAGEGPGRARDTTAQHEGERDMDPKEAPKGESVDVEAVRSEAVVQERQGEKDRVTGIIALKRELAGKVEGLDELADTAISEGRSLTAFQADCLKKVGERSRPKETPSTLENMEDPSIGMNEREIAGYSLLRAAQAFARNENCPELEYSQEAQKKLGNRSLNGFGIPYEVLASPNFLGERTTVTTTTTGSGLKGTTHLAGSFIDLLTAKTIIGQLGAQMMPGLVGDVQIPKFVAGATVGAKAEGADADEDTTTDIDVITLTPHTITGFVPVTRRMLIQSAPGIEMLVRRDLVRQVLIKADRLAFSGAGGAEPTGLLNRSIGAGPSLGTDGGPVTWECVTALEAEVAIDDAETGALAYATNPKVRSQMKNTPKNVTHGGRFIWDTRDGDTPLNSYPVAISNVVPANLAKNASGNVLSALVYGNWNDLLVGMWGIIDILPNPYTQAKSGGLLLHVFYDYDVVPRHDESFAASEEIAA